MQLQGTEADLHSRAPKR